MAQKTIRVRRTKDVLVDVDIQPTFMPGGGLAVPDGDAIVPTVHLVHRHFVRAQRFLTLDRHPRGHISLASSYVGLAPFTKLDPKAVSAWTEESHGISGAAKFTLAQLRTYLAAVGRQDLWPDHAIAGTRESGLCPALDPLDYVYAQIKGMDPACDSYSGFRDNLRRMTGLVDRIAAHVPGAERIFLTGLAYDYCVGWTALDASEIGYDVIVIKDATRAIDQGGSVAAIEESFRRKGIRVVESSQLGPF